MRTPSTSTTSELITGWLDKKKRDLKPKAVVDRSSSARDQSATQIDWNTPPVRLAASM